MKDTSTGVKTQTGEQRKDVLCLGCGMDSSPSRVKG